jgi:hypothetical protein
MKKMLNEGNQIHNFISSSSSRPVISYGSTSGSDFLTSHGSGSGSVNQKVTVPTVPFPVPISQQCPPSITWEGEGSDPVEGCYVWSVLDAQARIHNERLPAIRSVTPQTREYTGMSFPFFRVRFSGDGIFGPAC